MNRLLPQSLAGRLVALLVLALFVSQILTFAIFVGERRMASRLIDQENILARTVSMVRLLQESPIDLHQRLARTASTRRFEFWLSRESAIGQQPTDRPSKFLAQELKDVIGPDARTVRADVSLLRRWRRAHDDDRERYRRHRHRGPQIVGISVSVELAPDRWLNVAGNRRRFGPARLWPWIISLVVSGLAITLVVVLVIRRITQPMARLAEAADRFGRGEDVDPLPESGPREVRSTTTAFNQMRERLHRFVEDRTRMLAAISHDLRTPITTLRLRAEFIEDEETRSKILETLDEMQSMAEATLAFVREQSEREDTRTVDLTSLVSSLCDDLADLGKDVRLVAPGKILCRCRPNGIKRVLRNIIENAVRYGERARVKLEQHDATISVTVDDDGPGIPSGDVEDVFQPFVRLEGSRSKETGGVGLGLAIARSIIRNHGGDITLENRVGGGLSAIVSFPDGTSNAD